MSQNSELIAERNREHAKPKGARRCLNRNDNHWITRVALVTLFLIGCGDTSAVAASGLGCDGKTRLSDIPPYKGLYCGLPQPGQLVSGTIHLHVDINPRHGLSDLGLGDRLTPPWLVRFIVLRDDGLERTEFEFERKAPYEFHFAHNYSRTIATCLSFVFFGTQQGTTSRQAFEWRITSRRLPTATELCGD